jgi:hypothetical protein
MRRRAAAVLLVTGWLGAQAAPTPTALLERCRALTPERRAEVVRTLEQRLVRDRNEHLQRIQSSARGAAAYGKPEPSVWFEPSEFAPIAAARHLVAAGTTAHRSNTAGMRPFACLPELHGVVHYDWGRAVAVHGSDELGADQRLENYANGLPPAADQAVARALAVLDQDPRQHRLAAFFEHLYADRQGQVFAGVTLFDAWRAGTVVEMPDTDAIAFARQILGSRAFVSPIPADRRRERLYEQVREAFSEHREYRTLRLALAATYVAAHPTLDATYQDLVPRCHWLWQESGEDPRRLAERLAATKDRTTLLREVDARLQEDSAPAEQRCQELEEMATHLRGLVDADIAGGND